jgi:hypothetical protein
MKSGVESAPATKLFRESSESLLSSRKTSASSIRTTAFHLSARVNASRRPSSTDWAFVPRVDASILIRSLRYKSATLSIVVK